MRFILICFILFPMHFFGQISIQGIIIDKDTKLPISSVVVLYGDTQNDYIFSNENGQFSIPPAIKDSIKFQYIGYKTISIHKSQLLNNSTIEMEIDPIGLKPIEISVVNADKLLTKVMQNTREKLLVDEAINYLLHFKQTKETKIDPNTDPDISVNEIYLRYVSELTKKALKKNKDKDLIPYKLSLVDIKRVQRSGIATDMYGAEYHASRFFSFSNNPNYRTTISYPLDTTLLLLKFEPKKNKNGQQKGSIYLNKEDLTIYSIDIQSIDSILEEQPYKKFLGQEFKPIRKTASIEFRNINGKYYMTDCFIIYKFRTLLDDNKKEELSYYIKVDAIEEDNKNRIKKRKLGGYIQELFYIPNTTEIEFW